MLTRTAPGPGPFALPRAARVRLEDRAARAAELAGKEGERSVAAVTVAVPADLDLSAAVLAARGRGARAGGGGGRSRPTRPGILPGRPPPGRCSSAVSRSPRTVGRRRSGPR